MFFINFNYTFEMIRNVGFFGGGGRQPLYVKTTLP